MPYLPSWLFDYPWREILLQQGVSSEEKRKLEFSPYARNLYAVERLSFRFRLLANRIYESCRLTFEEKKSLIMKPFLVTLTSIYVAISATNDVILSWISASS